MGKVVELPKVPPPLATPASEMRAERLAMAVIRRWEVVWKEKERTVEHYDGRDD